MKNSVTLALILGLVLLCGSWQSSATDLENAFSDVYMGGAELDASGNMSNMTAKIWKNGENYPLDLDATTSSGVLSMFVDLSGNVYAAGFIVDESGKTLATIWENGEKYFLNSGDAPIAQASSIFVTEDGIVYVAGYIGDGSDSFQAKVWKDGEDYPLNLEGIAISQASSILVAQDGSVYVGVTIFPYNEVLARGQLWKNGENYPLNAKETTKPSGILPLYVDGKGSVYAGLLEMEDNSFSFALFKDGEEYPLTLDGMSDVIIPTCLHVTSAGDIYVGAMVLDMATMLSDSIEGIISEESKIAIWKNGKEYLFDRESLTGSMLAIAAIGVAMDGTVYVVGTDVDITGSMTAKAWRDGEVYPLDLEGVTSSIIYSVYVAP